LFYVGRLKRLGKIGAPGRRQVLLFGFDEFREGLEKPDQKGRLPIETRVAVEVVIGNIAVFQALLNC
jgi:hypothetical protein